MTDDIDREQLYTALRRADKAGDTKAARRLAEYIRSLPAPSARQDTGPKSAGDQVPGGGQAGNRNVGKPDQEERPTNGVDIALGKKGLAGDIFDKVMGAVEVPVTMASGAIAAPVGALAAVGKTIANGNYGKQDKAAEDFGGRVAQALTFQPRTKTGAQGVAKLADLAERSGVAGLGMPELNAAGHAIGDAGRFARGALLAKAAETNAPINAADAATAAATGPKLADLVRAPSQLSGVGAAKASKAIERTTRAESLPVPIKLTKGQATRDRQQVSFERETAKQKEGEKLAAHYEDQNARFMQNLDAGVDETGAQSVDRRDVGKSVVSAIEAKAAAKKAIATDLYKQARAAGETAEHVDVSALADWVAKNKGKDKVAPIIATIESELKQNAKEEGGRLDPLTLTPTPKRTTMTLDASEDLRQAINKLAEPGTPNSKFGREAQRIIDAATEDKGGPLYRQARRAWENYSKEFVDRGVVSKLLRTKPGSTDRAVALEKVVDHAVLSPSTSTDDLRHMVRVLTAYPEGTAPEIVEAGQQALRDLRGAVIDHIQAEITKNVNIDATGRATGSAAKINGIVNTLDRSGKLKVLFGPEGAQRIRDLRDVALDIYTNPAGTVNHSGTAAELVRQGLMQKLGDLANYAKAIPGAGSGIKYMGKQITSATTRRKVRDAINPKLSDLAKGGD